MPNVMTEKTFYLRIKLISRKHFVLIHIIIKNVLSNFYKEICGITNQFIYLCEFEQVHFNNPTRCRFYSNYLLLSTSFGYLFSIIFFSQPFNHFKYIKKKQSSIFIFPKNPSAPAGGISFVQIQEGGFQVRRIILEALSEGENQTCRTAFIFHQLYSLPWKQDRVTQD